MMRGVASKRASVTKAPTDDPEEPQDLLSLLPNKILLLIILLLPIGDMVRTSILSKRWLNLWKHVSHLDFDAKSMICAPRKFVTSTKDHQEDKEKGMYRYGMILFLILRQHLGELNSCCLRHFPVEDVETWIRYLIERKPELKNLTLECQEFVDGTRCKQNLLREFDFDDMNVFLSLVSLEFIKYCINSASLIDACKNLRILIMKEVTLRHETINRILTSCVSLEKFSLIRCRGFSTIKVQSSSLKYLELNLIIIDEIGVFAECLEVVIISFLCFPPKKLVFKAPNIREFRCSGNRHIASIPHVLKTPNLLEFCCGILEPERRAIYQNLSLVSVDLDLSNTREALALSNMLKASPNLETLKIFIPHSSMSITRNAGGALQQFWGGEIWNCIRRKLKFVFIGGFTGRDLEMDFIKYLIIRSTKLQKITIVSNSSTNVAAELLSLTSASPDLIIMLKNANE